MKRAVLIVVLLVLGYAALPYWSAHALGNALRDGDEKALAAGVDWQQLRANLGEDLTQVAAAQTGQSEGLRGLLLARLAPELIDAGLEAGLTPEQALRAAGVNAASALGVGLQLGRIAVGSAADLVIVDGDPLASIDDALNVVGVVRNGRFFSTIGLLDRVPTAQPVE